MRDWLTSTGQSLLSSADSLTAVLVAILVLRPALIRWYEGTIGARVVARRRLSSLSIGNPRAFVESLFGVPLYDELRLGRRPEYTRPHELEIQEIEIHLRLYRFRYGWVTGHYVDDTLVAFGFVVSDPRLKFDLTRFSWGQLSGTLGRTPFANLTIAAPSLLYANAGAASAPAIYSESH